MASLNPIFGNVIPFGNVFAVRLIATGGPSGSLDTNFAFGLLTNEAESHLPTQVEQDVICFVIRTGMSGD